MRTAIYVRVSTVTHSQQHTLEEQINRLRVCLLSRGEAMADEHIFRDEGRSGATLNRPALDRLRDQVRLGDYDRILITSPDRLARNYVHQMLLLEELNTSAHSSETGCDAVVWHAIGPGCYCRGLAPWLSARPRAPTRPAGRACL